jgi:hypothetical protein
VNFGTCKVMLLLLLIVICCDAISQVQWFSDCWNFFSCSLLYHLVHRPVLNCTRENELLLFSERRV